MITTSQPCPSSFNCTESPSLVSFDIGVSPSYVGIVSSSLSCLGSILIVFAFYILKDLRTVTQKIITLLAVADFISAAGYILGSSNFIIHFNQTDGTQCTTFQIICVVQATITSWSSLVSFCWTVILAFHFFLIIVYQQMQVVNKLLPVYNIVAWGGPLLIVIPLLGTGKLGYAPYAASNWCFVADTNYTSSKLSDDGLLVAIILVAGKGWELLSYIVVTLLYILIIVHVGKTRRQLKNTRIGPRMLQVEWRMMAIPLLFVLLRMWGTLQFFFSLTQPANSCILPSTHTVFVILGILQAIGDGGQGWGNAILYVILSTTIRTRLLDSVCGVCIDTMKERLYGADTREGTSSRSLPEQRNVNRQSSTSPLLLSKQALGYNVTRYNSSSSTSEDLQSYNRGVNNT